MAQHGQEIDSSVVASMPYAEATIKEALRLVPIVGVLVRVALKTFEIGGYTIPKARLASSSLDCKDVQASHWQFVRPTLQSIIGRLLCTVLGDQGQPPPVLLSLLLQLPTLRPCLNE